MVITAHLTRVENVLFFDPWTVQFFERAKPFACSCSTSGWTALLDHPNQLLGRRHWRFWGVLGGIFVQASPSCHRGGGGGTVTESRHVGTGQILIPNRPSRVVERLWIAPILNFLSGLSGDPATAGPYTYKNVYEQDSISWSLGDTLSRRII